MRSCLRPEHGEWEVVYRPFLGWFAVPDLPRHQSVEGEFLGKDATEAMKAISQLF